MAELPVYGGGGVMPRARLEHVRRDDEPLALISLVLSRFLRVVSHHRVFREPTPLAIAVDFVEAAVVSVPSLRWATRSTPAGRPKATPLGAVRTS
jgi:hypothetical protein